MNSKIALPVFAITAAVIAATLWTVLLATGGLMTERARDTAVSLSGGGNPEHGKEVIEKVGCAGCHEIPGVPGAQGKIGPSLAGFKDRAMIAGVMANSSQNLAAWIQDPRHIDEKTAMPNLGLSADQARDVSAYLYSITGQ